MLKNRFSRLLLSCIIFFVLVLAEILINIHGEFNISLLFLAGGFVAFHALAIEAAFTKSKILLALLFGIVIIIAIYTFLSLKDYLISTVVIGFLIGYTFLLIYYFKD